jgi:hypothetical protein
MPAQYQQSDTSGLTAEVSERGPNVLSFEVIGPRRDVKPSASSVMGKQSKSE